MNELMGRADDLMATLGQQYVTVPSSISIDPSTQQQAQHGTNPLNHSLVGLSVSTPLALAPHTPQQHTPVSDTPSHRSSAGSQHSNLSPNQPLAYVNKYEPNVNAIGAETIDGLGRTQSSSGSSSGSGERVDSALSDQPVHLNTNNDNNNNNNNNNTINNNALLEAQQRINTNTINNTNNNNHQLDPNNNPLLGLNQGTQAMDLNMGHIHPLAHQLTNGLSSHVIPATSTAQDFANFAHTNALLHYPMRADLSWTGLNQLRTGGGGGGHMAAALNTAPSRRYPCKICTSAFDSRAELTVHNQVHMRETKPYKCLQCPKQFANSSYLSQHMRIHNQERKFGPCQYCKKYAFDSRAELTVHNQVHMRETKPYKCLQCPKQFANSSYLSQHMRIHNQTRPFGPCQYCNRKFTQLSHLQQHIRTHTGEKPYQCKYQGCEKKFSQLSNLQSHSRCHQSDKPFKCNSCYKCFTDETSLLEHIPKHKESKHLKIHLCPYCGKSYAQSTYLAKHMAKHSDRVDRSTRLRELNSTSSVGEGSSHLNNHVGNAWPSLNGSQREVHICTVHGVPDSCAETPVTATPALSFANTDAIRAMMQQQQSAAGNMSGSYPTSQSSASDASAFALAGLARFNMSNMTSGYGRNHQNFQYDPSTFNKQVAVSAAHAIGQQTNKHNEALQRPMIGLQEIQRFGQSTNTDPFSAIMRNYC